MKVRNLLGECREMGGGGGGGGELRERERTHINCKIAHSSSLLE